MKKEATHFVMREIIQSIGECITGAMDSDEINAHFTNVSGTTIQNIQYSKYKAFQGICVR